MPRNITNRYPGTCVCGVRVEAEAGTVHKEGQSWKTRCPSHAGVKTSAFQPDMLSTVAPSVAEEAYLARVEAWSQREEIPEPAPDISPRKDEIGSYTLMSGHEASTYQAAIFEHFQTGRSSAIVKAVAGSGKTTTMKNALRYLPPDHTVQMFAFNTEAAAQLKDGIRELEALGERSYHLVNAGTFHSVGFTALRKMLPGKATVDDRKCRKILAENLSPTEFKMYYAFVCRLVALAKGEGVGCLVPDTEEVWANLVEHHGLYLDAEAAKPEIAIGYARGVLAESTERAERDSWIDFDDMLYLVSKWGLRLQQNDEVICDESQDTSPVRRAMLHLALKPGGRLYAVGDPAQSIMGFTGASNEAMNLIAKEFGTRELPLTVSYRCARTIVERAQVWVPYIEPSPLAREGEVLDDVPLCDALALLGPDDAILCRNNAPLVTLAYSLIARGRACRILGKEIGEGLVNLIEMQHAKGLERLSEKLQIWCDKQVAKFTAKGEESRAEAVSDRVECILTIVDALPTPERTVPALIRRIEGMFADPVRGTRILTLSTAHKAKGREWPAVAILRPELMPSKSARQSWQAEQEFNLMYVAATRAKERLIYVQDKDMIIDPIVRPTQGGD